jgi:1-acyl-sn-glycerol-3-phosphate acyltransferase
MWALAVCAAGLLFLLLRWRRSRLDLTGFILKQIVDVYGRLWKGCSCAGGKLRLPADGPVLIVANHTCSADASFLQTHADRALSYLMAGEFVDFLPMCGWLFDYLGCVMVKREGMDLSAIPTSLRRLREGRAVCIWPEGGLSGAGKKDGRRARCGVALLALRTSVPIYPVFISGGPQRHEVLPAWLLPSRARIWPGPPVDLSAYRGRRINRALLEEVTHYLMNQIFALDPERRQSEAAFEPRMEHR